MQQSSVIAFFLLGGFIIYITIKGELPSYAGILGIGPKAGTSPLSKVSNSGVVSGGTSTTGNALAGALNSALAY